MKKETFITPTRDQFKELMAMDYKGPIGMLNQVKFKKEGGKEAYDSYIEEIQEPFERVGGQVFNQGGVLMTVIGDEGWDEVFIAEYPSIDAFIELQRDKVYQAAVPHRDEAIEDSRLIAIKLEKK